MKFSWLNEKSILHPYCKQNTIVIGIPRGGVILSHEIAKELNLPEDVIVVRKVGCPGQPEFAIGAISQTGNVVLDHSTMHRLGISEDDVSDTIQKEKLEAQRRLKVDIWNYSNCNKETT